MARVEGEPVYIGEGYGDTVEPEGLPVEVQGDYLQLTDDVIDLVPLRNLELKRRRAVDRYDEKLVLLYELAERKWK